MKVVLMHGKDTSPDGKWYPWIGEQLKNLGIEHIAPFLPDPDNPKLEEWLAELSNTNPDADTVLVGHSRGGVAILRYLEKLPSEARVKKVILVATNKGFTKDLDVIPENNFGFFTDEGYNFNAIKEHCDEFVVLHSKDDEWVPFTAGEENAKGLGARFITFEGRGHFGKNQKEFTELLEVIHA